MKLKKSSNRRGSGGLHHFLRDHFVHCINVSQACVFRQLTPHTEKTREPMCDYSVVYSLLSNNPQGIRTLGENLFKVAAEKNKNKQDFFKIVKKQFHSSFLGPVSKD